MNTAVPSARSGELEIVRGDAASRLIADGRFAADWNRLHEACPWASSYQGRAFVSSWYDSYASRYQPVVVTKNAPGGELAGLLCLALDRASGELVAAGAHQAEYQGWLAAPDDDNGFIHDAVRLCADATGAPRLCFHFLAPGAPIDWCRAGAPTTAGGGSGLRSIVTTHLRPKMAVGPSSPVEASLRKKSNKSRLSRLERLGPVRLEHIETADRLEEVIDRIAVQCDFRQGAVNDVLPFASDSLKRDFHLRQSAHPKLLHTSVLWVGDEVAASHIGTVNGTSVVLGVITHSPFLAAHSPGKLILLLLGRMLGAQGFEFFDLTPVGAYKDRSATDVDTVFTAEFFFRRRDFAKARLRRVLAVAARRALAAVGLGNDKLPKARARLKQLASRLRPPSPRSMGAVLAGARRRLWSGGEYRIYHMTSDMVRAMKLPVPSPELRTNDLGDLLRYSAPVRSTSRQGFLLAAMERLERGQLVCTYVENGELLHHAWLDPHTSGMGTDYGHDPVALPPGSAVLWDDFTHPKARGRGLHKASVCHRLRLFAETAVEGPEPRWVFTGVRADNTPSRRNMEKAGFVYCRSAWVVSRLGRRRYRVDPPCDACAADTMGPSDSGVPESGADE